MMIGRGYTVSGMNLFTQLNFNPRFRLVLTLEQEQMMAFIASNSQITHKSASSHLEEKYQDSHMETESSI